MYEYKVERLSSGMWNSIFVKSQERMNEMAKDGWRAVHFEVAGSEAVVVFEKLKPNE